jgi:ubiquinone/menaquinone biosynthesis C-methylase UbiE
MTGSTSQDKRFDARLRRGRRNWDLAARTYYTLFDRFRAPLDELALRSLRLGEGEAVLDIGCGTGAGLVALREAVGARGRVVGVDYSPRMVARARAVVRDREWSNVEIIQGDATREPLGDGEFDAAIALTSFSAMPDVPAAVANAHRALRPGGRLFVFDMRLVPTGGALSRFRTRVARLVYRITAGFTGADVAAELERIFATVTPVLPHGATRTGSSMTFLLATKAGT